MKFLWPQALWLLSSLPLLLGAYLILLRRRTKRAIRFPDVPLVHAALGRAHFVRRHLPPLLFFVGVAAAIAGLARPAADVTVLTPARTVVLAIDVSLSMGASDIKPTRLEAAKNAAKAFVQQRPSDMRIAMVSFSDSAMLVHSPTRDQDDLMAAIDRLQLQHSTAIGSAIALSLQTALPKTVHHELEKYLTGETAGRRVTAGIPLGGRKTSSAPDRTPVLDQSTAIILLTDGQNTIGPDPLEVARVAAAHGVRVYTIGLGDVRGGTVESGGRAINVEFDEATLKSIAAATQAEYLHAPSADALNTIYDSLITQFRFERANQEVTALAAAVAALLFMVAGVLSMRWFAT
jgi:Ca-activated chloride channel family protein